MNYIIDGHNLISKIPGLDLSMADDEQRLIDLLSRYCKLGGHRAEVYFDGAPMEQAGVRNYKLVRAHFVPQNQIADEAIRKRLRALGRSAKNWTLVSSDRSVQVAGREAHAQVLSAEEFAQKLIRTSDTGGESLGADREQALSPAEVQEW